MTGLSVRGLTVQRGSRLVLEDVSFSAASGGVTAILGTAGAGKTSLLSAIAGLAGVERGAVFLDGTELGQRAARRRIGFLAPGSILPEARTVLSAVQRSITRARRSAAPETLASPGARSCQHADRRAVAWPVAAGSCGNATSAWR